MSANSSAGEAVRKPAASIAQPATGSDNPGAEDWGPRGYDAVMQIPVSVRIVIGSARMSVSKLMSLTRGSMIQLDRKVGDPVDIEVNGQHVARGEIVVVDAETDRFAVVVRQLVHAGEE